MGFSRRHLLRDAVALGTVVAGAPLIVACAPTAAPASNNAPRPGPPATLAPPETKTVKIAAVAPCDPWVWQLEPLLREEGITEFVYPAPVKDAAFYTDYIHDTAIDFETGIGDRGVAGLHTGCIEIFAKPSIGTISDLRGKTVAVGARTVGVTLPDGRKVTGIDLFYGFWVTLLTHVGIRPEEVTWLETKDQDTTQDFVNGRADAVMLVGAGGPRLHAALPSDRYRVLLDTTMDKPFSQYYCCDLRVKDQWAAENPVALKRTTRAVLRAVDLVARDRRAAAKIAAEGIARTNPTQAAVLTEPIVYDTIKDLSYDWRESDIVDSMRFYVLKLADGKLIKKPPQQIIDASLDITWFKQLQKELKP